MRPDEALSRFVELTDDGVMITTAHRLDEPGPTITFVNTAFVRMSGYSPEEAVGRSPRFLQGPDTPPEARHLIRGALERWAPVRVDILNYRRDGTPFWIDLAIHPVRNEAGECENFVAVLHDISRLKDVELALRQSEARFRAVAELLPMAVAVTREYDGLILYSNPWLAEFFGAGVESATGRSIAEIYANPQDRENLRARLHEVEVVKDLEIEGHKPDGTPATALISARRIIYDGQPAILTVGTDVSKRKQQERQLREAEREARAAMRSAEAVSLARTRFFAAASHDLRQPYQAMRLLLPALTNQLTTPGQMEVADRLGEAMAAGENLLNALLDVSALEAGALHPKFVTFSVKDVLERLGREMEEQARVVGLRFRVVGCSAWVRSDPLLLQRILSNLLSNALRYTPQGGILLGCRRRNGHIRIEVWDTGVGISEEHFSDIFEDFVQIDNPERQRSRGLGLGLSIVARTAKLLGHRLDLRSARGRGSVFVLEVPEAADPGIETTQATGATKLERFEKRLIFVVEDDPVVLDALVRLLTSWGVEVVSALSIDELVDRMAMVEWPPCLILTDYHLGSGVTATDAIDLVRAHYKRGEIPALVLTAEPDPGYLRDALGKKQRILRKPIDAEALRLAIEQELRKS